MLGTLDSIVENFVADHSAQKAGEQGLPEAKYDLAHFASNIALGSTILWGLTHAYGESIKHCSPHEAGLMAGCAASMILLDKYIGIEYTRKAEQTSSKTYEEHREHSRSRRLFEIALGTGLSVFGIVGMVDHSLGATAISALPLGTTIIAHALSVYYRFAPAPQVKFSEAVQPL